MLDGNSNKYPWYAGRPGRLWWLASYRRGSGCNPLWRGNAGHVGTSPVRQGQSRKRAAKELHAYGQRKPRVFESQALCWRSWRGTTYICARKEWWRQRLCRRNCGSRRKTVPERCAVCGNRRPAGRMRVPARRAPESRTHMPPAAETGATWSPSQDDGSRRSAKRLASPARSLKRISGTSLHGRRPASQGASIIHRTAGDTSTNLYCVSCSCRFRSFSRSALNCFSSDGTSAAALASPLD